VKIDNLFTVFFVFWVFTHSGFFRNGEGDFGRPTAKNDRHQMLAGKSAVLLVHFSST
jgi:hypothetical protein